MAPRVPFQVPYPFVDGLDTQSRDQLYRNFEEVGGLFVPQTPYVPGTTPGSTSNSGITVGNGTETASYYRVGQLVHVTYLLVWGSTTSFSGSGAAAFGLPLPAKPDQQPGANIWFRDVAPQAQYTGGGILVDFDSDGNLTRFRPQVPITPGDKMGSWSRSTALSLPSGGPVFIPWDTEGHDTDAILTPTNDTASLSTPGTYLVTAYAATNTARSDYTRFQIGILANGAFWESLVNYDGPDISDGCQATAVATVHVPSVGRTLQVRVTQNNAGGATVGINTAGSVKAKFNITRIGGTGADSPLQNVNSLSPFKWTTNDVFQCGVTYEVADGY